jgi:hypothetical protein
MRGPPETICDEVPTSDGHEIIPTGRRLREVDYSEYEWMGEEGVEEFDRRVSIGFILTTQKSSYGTSYCYSKST